MTSVIRRCAEVLLGSVVIRRRIPASAGQAQLVVSGKVGGLKYLLKNSLQWDPELLKIAELLVKSGDVVWDVGANVGLFSKAAAVRSGPNGRIVSLEADIDAVALLNRTIRLPSTGHAEMTVIPVAVGKTSGFVQFAIAKRARAANAIGGHGSTQTGGTLETRTLPCVTSDSLLEHFPGPDMLKIDAEGAECDVLEGALQVLRRVRPVIYYEVSDQAEGRVSELLRQHSYVMWSGQEFDGTEKCGNQSATFNTVAIPQEKRGGYLNVEATKMAENP